MLNALQDEFGHDYDALYANAVFLHFRPEQFQVVLRKSFDCLKPGGILAFSVKRGEGDGWSDHNLGAPRYFHYWQMSDLQEAVKAADFKIVELSERAGSGDNYWLQIIARK
jgi:SAM-dependent methyltransferase